jgi:hypothetical protein
LKARYDAIRLQEQEMNGVTWQAWAEQAMASAWASQMTSNMLQGQSQVSSNAG